MNTDWQAVINIVFALGGGLGGWVLTTLWKEIKDARKDHSDLLDKLPNIYARRDDVREGFQNINSTLLRIEGKLDSKADKAN